MIEVWQKRYYGNIGLGKALTLSYTCGRCLNTNGLFVVVNGPAGFGKSAGMKTMLDLMPPEFVKQGKESAQAMYYDDMAPGTIRYIDEIKFDNDIKEAWTYFQSRTSFVKRLWLSCVDKGDEIR